MKTRIDLDEHFDGRRPHYCPEYTRQIKGMVAFALMLPVALVALAVAFAPQLETFWTSVDQLFDNPILSLMLIGSVSAAIGGRWLFTYLTKK